LSLECSKCGAKRGLWKYLDLSRPAATEGSENEGKSQQLIPHWRAAEEAAPPLKDSLYIRVGTKRPLSVSQQEDTRIVKTPRGKRFENVFVIGPPRSPAVGSWLDAELVTSKKSRRAHSWSSSNATFSQTETNSTVEDPVANLKRFLYDQYDPGTCSCLDWLGSQAENPDADASLDPLQTHQVSCEWTTACATCKLGVEVGGRFAV